jgi:dTDP-4-dehydrorhamnose reductase
MKKKILHTHAGLAECIDTLPDTTRLLYCSTMIGKGKNQSETISPSVRLDGDYLKEYFNGKIEGERIVQKHANHVIIRPGSIYGYDCDGNLDKRMKKLLEQASNGLTYKRTANMYTSFIHISDLTNAILELSENDFKGILNISCENPVSYYEFNRHLAGLLKIDKNVVVADYKPDELYNTFSNTLRKTVLKSPIREIE